MLGPHPDESGRGLVIRAFQPAARAVDVRLPDGSLLPMSRRAPAALSRRRWARRSTDYRLRVTYVGDHVVESTIRIDMAACSPTSTCICSAKARTTRAFEKLGAHRITVGTTTGVHFAVWAPNAERVSLVGDFNGWDGRVHAMRLLLPNGIWEIFLPDLPDGERYKFEIRTRQGACSRRATPSASPSKCRRSRRLSSGISPATSGATMTG